MRQPQRSLAVAIVLVVAACGGGGGGGAPTPPSSLSYSAPAPTYVACVSIAPNVPAVTGNVTTWSVSPALPPGLALHPTSGIITGTPSATAPAAVHTVTATGPGGSTTTNVAIAVDAPPPPLIAYPDTAPFALVDVAETFTPSFVGAPGSWSIAPALPAGLSIDPASGIVAGTATATAPATTYTVTAEDCIGGSTTTTFDLAVADPASLIETRFLHVASADGTILTLGVRADGLLRSAGHDVVAPDPVDIAASWTTRHLLVAHGNPPLLAVHRVQPVTGRLSPAVASATFPAGSAPRRVIVDEARRIAWVSLSGAAAVAGFALGGDGSLTPLTGSPFGVSGTGPTSLALAPDGSRLLVSNTVSGSVSVFTLAVDGSPIAEAATAVLPQPGELVVSTGTANPWVYVASGAAEAIGVYSLIGAALANVSVVPYGAGASPIVLDGAEVGGVHRLWVAHAALPGELLEYVVDPATGALTNETAASANGPTGTPVDLVLSRSQTRAFAVFAGPAETVTLTVDGSGSLAPAMPFGAPTNRMRTRPAPRRAAITHGSNAYAEVSDAIYVTNRQSGDVSQFAFDPLASTLAALVPADFASTPAPNGVATHPYRDVLYVAQDPQGPSSIALRRFALAPDGAATEVATLDAGLSIGGFHDLAIDRAGRWLAATARLDGRLMLYALDAAGVPTFAAQAQIGDLPTGVEFTPNGTFLYAVATIADGIHGFAVDPASGALTPVPGSPLVIPGAAPLDIAIHPSGRFLYVPCPGLDDVRGYEIDAVTGELVELGTSRFLSGLDPEYPAVAPTGRQVYVTNRSSDAVYGYRVNLADGNGIDDGTLTVPGAFAMPETPRGIAIDPGGAHLFVTLRPEVGVGDVLLMELDPTTGQVTALSTEPVGAVAGPIAIRTRAR